VEGSGRGLIIKELFKRFLEGTEENHEKLQRVYLVSWPRFEPAT
jgi:hypothetical protein